MLNRIFYSAIKNKQYSVALKILKIKFDLGIVDSRIVEEVPLSLMQKWQTMYNFR